MDLKKMPKLDNYYTEIFLPLLAGSTSTPTGDNNFSNISKLENNQNILLSPGRGSERKKNIIKMMQKLDKIKTGENSPSGTDSIKIKDNNQNEQESQKHSKFNIDKKEEEKNENDNGEKEIKILKKNNNEDKEENGIEDDSKLNIINKDDGFGLNQKKKKKVGGVQFKGVEEQKNGSDLIDSFNLNNINYNNTFPNNISNSNFIPGEQDTISALNQEEINEKYTHLKVNIGKKYNNEEIPTEEIEKKILNMIHSNLKAKILLNIGLFIFMVIFITSYVIYCLLDSNLEKARNFTFYYFQKTSIMNEKYKISITFN